MFEIIFGIIFGWLTFPLVIFLRARKDSSWDSSNMTNIYRLIAHIAIHPNDFTKVTYKNGKNPFWYIGKDEITDIVDGRPDENKQ